MHQQQPMQPMQPSCENEKIKTRQKCDSKIFSMKMHANDGEHSALKLQSTNFLNSSALRASVHARVCVSRCFSSYS